MQSFKVYINAEPERISTTFLAVKISGNQEADAWGYAGELKLINGTNTLRAKVTFADGHVEEATTQITYNGPARITITSQVDKAIMGPVSGANSNQSQVPGGSVNLSGNVERPVTITGRSDKPLQSVMINQQAAKITEGGLGFVFNNFYLREGNNMLSAVGTDLQGRKTSTSILVNVDQTAPLLSIESPQDQSLISRSKIDIRGTVNDAVEGLFQAPQPTLSV